MTDKQKKCGRCNKTKARCNCGRPTVVTAEAIRKLEEAFANGATDTQACFYANISTTAFYEYQKKHPEFTERKEGLKGQLGLIAKNQIAKAIKNGDTNRAAWYLERKEKDEYSTRNEHTGKDGEEIDLSVKVTLVPSNYDDSENTG